MNRKIFIILYIISMVSILQAQTLQKVIVMEYKGASGKKPLANVEVVVSNAGSVVTDKNGACTLHFRTLKPGDHVTIRRIYKEGYEVFNRAILDQWVISRSDEPFVIELVETKFLRKIEDGYRQPTVRAAASIYENQLKRVKSQYEKNALTKEEYNKRLEQLQNEYLDKLDDIDNYISQFSHIDLSSISRNEKKVVELLKEGDIAGAIEEYDRQDLVGQYSKGIGQMNELNKSLLKVGEAKSKVADAKSQLSQSVMTQVKLLQFAGGETNANRATELIYDMAKADTTNYDIILWAAGNLRKTHHLAQSEELVHYLLNSKDSLRICEGKMILGTIQTTRSNIEEGYKLQMEALKYFINQANEKNDSLYLLTQRAMAIRNAFKAIALRSDMSILQQFKGESQNVVKTNYLLNPTTANKRLYVEYLCHRSDVDRRLKKYDNAEKCLYEALQLQTELYEQDSRRQVAMLAYIYGRLAAVFIGANLPPRDWDKADENFKKCIEYYEIAYSINPAVYGRNYSSGLSQASMFTVVTGRGYEHAIENYELALKIYNQSLEIDPTAASAFPSSVWPYLGHAYTLNGDPEKGLAFLKQHLPDNIEWYKKNKIKTHLFRTYLYMCKACLTPQINDLDQAREYFKEAKALVPSSIEVKELSEKLDM